MSLRRDLWLLLPHPLRRLPADLVAVVAVIVFVNTVVYLPGIRETPIRAGLGLAFVLFIPGYTLIAALFPEASVSPLLTDDPATDDFTESDDNDVASGIDGIERVALSFGLSIAVVPLIGLVLNFTPWGIRLVPIMVAVSGVSLILTAVAASRRWAVPPEDRFQVPYQEWAGAARAELFEPATRTDTMLNVVLIGSVLLATGSVGFAITNPTQGESFSEFYLLTENETGELVADDYPTELERGQSRTLTVGIGNHEHERVNYTVVAELQQVTIVNNSTRVQEANELRRFQAVVGDNETWHRQHTITPQMTGDRLRLQYLLYKGEPATPLNRSAAYREVHLWVNVTG
ncbi:DUF1616 domain-containing protein [Haloarcula nitratireducens]|uniref:DUF1616 domain-containing protein n=1 Tax=Haloarcula nitratireducens TaxID=2487749 RepID=A0AAW4PIQ0_9EURY|nr:DUF1616 domain-containing protein [Halomicroarcula nitratireducens]MBX0297803.1 DUF1616 domain-containing protein [Halomicroarcula nitratireducens]